MWVSIIQFLEGLNRTKKRKKVEFPSLSELGPPTPPSVIDTPLAILRPGLTPSVSPLLQPSDAD